MIEIPENLLAEIVADALGEAPDEICGWLAGRDGRVERAYPVPNVAEDRRRAFLMEPEAQLRAMREIRDAGLDLTGTYHSHPKTPSRPSIRDRELALYPDSAHLIISLVGTEPEVACYRITDAETHPIEIAVREARGQVRVGAPLLRVTRAFQVSSV